MAAVPALAHFDHPYFHALSVKSRAVPVDEAAKLRNALETLFPDMLLHGTHSALLGMSTSLTKVSGQAHQYFSQVSQALAFDRMVRSFMRFTAAVSPFPVDYGANWSGMFTAGPPASPLWGFASPAPKPAPALSFFPAAFQPNAAAGHAPSWLTYGTMMMVPMGLFAAAPRVDHLWGFTA